MILDNWHVRFLRIIQMLYHPDLPGSYEYGNAVSRDVFRRSKDSFLVKPFAMSSSRDFIASE